MKVTLKKHTEVFDALASALEWLEKSIGSYLEICEDVFYSAPYSEFAKKEREHRFVDFNQFVIHANKKSNGKLINHWSDIVSLKNKIKFVVDSVDFYGEINLTDDAYIILIYRFCEDVSFMQNTLIDCVNKKL